MTSKDHIPLPRPREGLQTFFVATGWNPSLSASLGFDTGVSGREGASPPAAFFAASRSRQLAPPPARAPGRYLGAGAGLSDLAGGNAAEARIGVEGTESLGGPRLQPSPPSVGRPRPFGRAAGCCSCAFRSAARAARRASASSSRWR